MLVAINENHEIPVFQVERDRICISNVNDLSRVLIEIMHKESEFVLDLSQVNFIDSLGVGTLISLIRSKEAQKKNVYIANVQPAVALIFEVLQVQELIPAFSSVAEALNQYRLRTDDSVGLFINPSLKEAS